METARIAHRSLPRLPSYAGDRFPSKSHLGIGDFRVSERPRNFFGRLNARFSDSGHQQYYVSTRREAKKREKEKSSEIKSVKKKLKFIKRLSSDLSLFSLDMYGKESGNSLMNEEKISEAVQVLQAQLQELRLEQKELKRSMKEQVKTSLKQIKGKHEFMSSSSSSSSESSDSDKGEVIDMIRLRSNLFKQSENGEAWKEIKERTVAKPSLLIQQENSEARKEIKEPTLARPSLLIQQEELSIGELSSKCSREDSCLRGGGECSSSNSFSNDQSKRIVEETSTKRIEICMGGKCKKAGAGALLEEFERKAGAECDVLVCKCTGKCKDGPNIRVSDSPNGVQGYARPSINSLCIGVGLDDVDMILANILGGGKDKHFQLASS
ncbi:Diacylglycerol acyltransferase [Melia azedarach]|uniref:Diacylglycerol acyltransferase n=1 Tax=Melia azedarach TaxID=155640 RepID=A0ACC1YZ81_MELAZ|nr:Diacylglycerol acyltransferase [Melia azedarach]